MSTYVAILRQDNGCDYTIGCGVNVIRFEASDSIEAALKLKDIIGNDYSHEERKLKSVVYYETKGTYEVDLDRWYSELEYENRKAKEDEVIAKELAELERLQKKYNP